jgi:hypothetical protein
MTAKLPQDILQDHLAVSLACAVAIANKKADALGINVPESLISITQNTLNGSPVWQINYGRKDYINQRGGDLLVEVDMEDAIIKRVLHGQ